MAEPLASAEVRWFLAGRLPGEVAAWFVAADATNEPERRVDRYLRLPGAEGVGAKLRDGRFELKARTCAPTPLQFTPNVAGLADGWVKRSFADAELGARLLALTDAPDWIDVAKARATRTLGPDPDGAAGATLELAELRIEGAAWWSLALETFGTAAPDFALLEAAAKLAFAEPPPLGLALAGSAAYPAWLGRFAGP